MLRQKTFSSFHQEGSSLRLADLNMILLASANYIRSIYTTIKLFNIRANFIGRRWLMSIRSFISHRVHRELRDFFIKRFDFSAASEGSA
jgi:hypothetical protein